MIQVFAGALSGALWAAVFPPLELPMLAWVGLVPFFLVALRGARWAAFSAGFVMWAAFIGIHLAWAFELKGVHALNFSLAAALVGLGVGALGAALAAFALRSPRWVSLGFPAAWVCWEKLRLELGFAAAPWGLLGDSQYCFLPLIQLAAWTGNLGVSFLVVWVNAALAQTLFRAYTGRSERLALPARLGTALACVTGVVVFGGIVLANDPPRETLRVAVLQADVYRLGIDPPEKRREIWERYARLTRELAAQRPSLVTWPSSAVPSLIPADAGLVQRLAELATESGAYLLVGSAGQEKSRPGTRKSSVANSAFLISPQGKLAGHYDKIRLLPFNEYVPLRGVVRWPQWISSYVVDARAGRDRTVFRMGSVRFGVLICWENLFADEFRASAARGVDFMVSMTNEAFTTSEAAHRQMHAINVMRAVENGVSVVRAATTGISSVVDPRGRIARRLRDENGRELNSIASAVVDVPLAPERSFYSSAGDWFVALAAAGLALASWPRRVREEPRRGPA